MEDPEFVVETPVCGSLTASVNDSTERNLSRCTREPRLTTEKKQKKKTQQV